MCVGRVDEVSVRCLVILPAARFIWDPLILIAIALLSIYFSYFFDISALPKHPNFVYILELRIVKQRIHVTYHVDSP